MTWPAGSVSSSAGTNCSSPTSPRSQAEPVSSYICQPTATISICAAVTLARRATHSRMKSRCAKSEGSATGRHLNTALRDRARAGQRGRRRPFSRTAQYLNSGILATGSSAGLVSLLIAASAQQKATNTVPGGEPSSARA
jgi:hypothetical protein